MTEDEQTTTMPAVAFEAPLPGADVKRCPACLSPVRADQRYCLECGERLLADEIPPPPGGGSALADRSTSLLVVAAVVLALAGVGLALVALRDGTDSGGGTATATDTMPTTDTLPTMPTTDTLPTMPTTDTLPTMPTTETMPTDTVVVDDWPPGQTGWAVILSSKSQSQFQEADADAIADEAMAAGVPLVGVLDSSQFPSLNPGYWAVFSGPYASEAEAEAAATTIRGQGYPDAYPREVQP